MTIELDPQNPEQYAEQPEIPKGAVFTDNLIKPIYNQLFHEGYPRGIEDPEFKKMAEKGTLDLAKSRITKFTEFLTNQLGSGYCHYTTTEIDGKEKLNWYLTETAVNLIRVSESSSDFVMKTGISDYGRLSSKAFEDVKRTIESIQEKPNEP